MTGRYLATDEPISVRATYPRDGEDVLRRYDTEHDDPVERFRDLPNRNRNGDTNRGNYIEDHIAPDVLEEERGYEILCKGADCGGDNGIDILAWDPDANDGDGELVVVDSKWTTDDGSTGVGTLGPGRDVNNNGENCIQMSQCWVEDSVDEIPHSAFEDVDSGTAEQIFEKYGPEDGTYHDDLRGTQVKNSILTATRHDKGDAVEGAADAEYRRELFISKPKPSGEPVTDSRLRGRENLRDKYTDTDLSEYIDGTHHVYLDEDVLNG